MRRRPTVRLAAAAALAGAALACAGCSYGLQDLFGRADPVAARIAEGGGRSLPDLSGVAGGFRFVVSADLHFRTDRPLAPARLAAFQAVVDAESPAFAVFVGDLADAGGLNEFQAFRSWADGLAKPGGGSLPWFAALGNHDLYNGGWNGFRTLVGPSYYRLSAGAVSLYVVDSANGTLGQAQLDRLAADFAADPKPKLVFCHYPVRGNDAYVYYRLTNPRERAWLLDLFARNRVAGLFVGHYHYPFDTDCNAFRERIAGSFTDGADGKGHCWVVDVDAAGAVSASQRDL